MGTHNESINLVGVLATRYAAQHWGFVGHLSNLFDLFLEVYALLAAHTSAVLSAGPQVSQEELWLRLLGSRSPIGIADDEQLVGAFRQRLVSMAPGYPQGTLVNPRASTPMLITFLRAVSEIIAGAMDARDQSTYPDPPMQGPVIVRRPANYYFETLRSSLEREPPPGIPPGGTNDFDRALQLDHLYVVPRLEAGDAFTWKISRVPPRWRSQIRRSDASRIALISFPHSFEDIQFDPDRSQPTFRVVGLGDEADLCARLSRALEALVRAPVDLLVCPELTGSPRVRSVVQDFLENSGVPIAFTCPGSWHQSVHGIWRNRCKILGPQGQEDDEFFHDKITPYPLPENIGTRLGFPGPTLEGIDGSHRRVAIWDLPGLGRVVVLICLDVLDPFITTFLRRHRFGIDHIFVPSMSDELGRFSATCSELGRWLDAGIYVANTTAGNGHDRQAAYVYLPFRGAQKSAIQSCTTLTGNPHRICIRIVDLSALQVSHFEDF
jgi:hypothetical protein